MGKLLLALHTYGTNDVYGDERFLVWSRYLGVSLYRAAWDFNHPASMIHVLRAMGWLAVETGRDISITFRCCAGSPSRALRGPAGGRCSASDQDYALAQNNLAWALNQKRLRGADAGSP